MGLSHLSALPRRSSNVLRSLVDQNCSTNVDPRLGRVLAWPRAFRSVWQARSDILTFIRTGDEVLGHDLRRRFGLAAGLAQAVTLPENFFDSSPNGKVKASASVIVPIYNAAKHVDTLLETLLRTVPAEQHVILVDDGSDDDRIRTLARRFKDAHSKAEILLHPQNLGFVNAVNSALQNVPRGNHVVLLNTDTRPPPNWLPRMLAPLADETVASVTPLSNNAEILSVPRSGVSFEPSDATLDQMDATAQTLRFRDVDLPTGVGFCLALSRRYLDQIGGFDPEFGKGYGEEVDWCLKATALGGRHTVATNLVVGHVGNASFGEEARRKHVARASRLIAARYANYSKAALDWERRDPLAAERLAIALAWTAGEAVSPVPIYLAHVLGGGAETALLAEVNTAFANGRPAVVVLRVGGPAQWRVELKGPRFALAADLDDTRLLHRLLRPVTDREVIYSCGVHAKHPETIPNTLLELADGHSLAVRLHDFYPISPSWNLLNQEGRFEGVPSLTTKDVAHAGASSHESWREAWGKVMARAEEVTVFAKSGAALVQEAYPEAAHNITLRPHKITHAPRRLTPGGKSIGVLGAINHAKGASVLERLSRLSTRRIAIIGALDGKFSLHRPNVVHGPYEQHDIAKLARRYDVGTWFIPSVCPETFSFATHEALATGLPVASFNLGAQADALEAAANGHVLDVDPDDTGAIDAALERLFEKARAL
ncbi:MAG: glycosyltransferase [Pseudomonadota bacterium]